MIPHRSATQSIFATVSSGSPVAPAPAPTSTSAHPWRDIAVVVATLFLVLGLGCFMVGAEQVHDAFGSSLNGAFALTLVFVAGASAVVGVVVALQRRQGGSWRDFGWRRPTRWWVLVIAVVYGLAWTSMSYVRDGDPLAMPWQRIPMALLGVWIAFGEEIAVRGLIMDRLQQVRVPTWAQILFTGVLMGLYHGVIGWHFLPASVVMSVILFSLVSVLYVVGGRSLTPVLVAHGMTHLLGDPALMRGILQVLDFLH